MMVFESPNLYEFDYGFLIDRSIRNNFNSLSVVIYICPQGHYYVSLMMVDIVYK